MATTKTAPKRRANGQGSVYWAPDKRRWIGAYTDPATGKRHKVSDPDRNRAEQLLAAALAGVGTVIVGKGSTVAEWMQLWLLRKQTAVEQGKLARTTYKTYESLTRTYIIELLGRFPLRDLTPDHIDIMLNKVARMGKSSKTRIEIRNILKAALNDAVPELIVANPAMKSTAPGRRRKPTKFLDYDQVQKLLSALESGSTPSTHAYFHTLLGTGMRRGEAMGLRWDDIDWQQGLVRVGLQLVRERGYWELRHLKTDESLRTLEVSDRVLEVLRQHKARQQERVASGVKGEGDRLGLVFTTSTGNPLTPDNLLRSIQGAARRAGLGHVTIHGLRHTFATLMLEAGLSMKDVQELLGHADIQTTMNIYAHVTPAARGKARRAANEIVSGTVRELALVGGE